MLRHSQDVPYWLDSTSVMAWDHALQQLRWFFNEQPRPIVLKHGATAARMLKKTAIPKGGHNPERVGYHLFNQTATGSCL